MKNDDISQRGDRTNAFMDHLTLRLLLVPTYNVSSFMPISALGTYPRDFSNLLLFCHFWHRLFHVLATTINSVLSGQLPIIPTQCLKITQKFSFSFLQNLRAAYGIRIFLPSVFVLICQSSTIQQLTFYQNSPHFVNKIWASLAIL